MTERTDKIEEEPEEHTDNPSNNPQPREGHRNLSKNCAEHGIYNGLNRENISHIINRRNRILNHIRREQFLICFPNTQPFFDERNAYESLLPYHIFFRNTTEDFLFLNMKSANKDFDTCKIINWVNEEIDSIERNFEKNCNMVLNLMDLEAHKFILNKHVAQVEEATYRTNDFKRRAPLLLNRRKLDRRRNAVVRLKLAKEDFDSHRYVRAVNEKLFFRREQ